MQNLGLLGAPITLDECGFYIAHNRADGSLNSVFCLRYLNDDWYFYQLKHQAATAEAEEALFWQALGDASDGNDNALQSMPTTELQSWLQKPALQDPALNNPAGGWQVLRNARFGFGKFTPAAANSAISYALLRFRDGQMLGPILIEKTTDPAITALAEIGF